MTSISSSGFGVPPSPFDRVQNTLKRDVDAGTISATDGTALASAISDIGSQLQAGGATATAATGTSTATGSTTPTSMKDRVDSMIDGEVSSGKLTSDQASELKQVFAQAHAHMHGAHGHGGGDGGGAIDALTGSSSDGTDAVTGSSAVGGTSATSPVSALETAATSAITALESFLTQFKSAVSANSTYGATGSSSSAPASMLINAIA